jgi:hypothetical protein
VPASIIFSSKHQQSELMLFHYRIASSRPSQIISFLETMQVAPAQITDIDCRTNSKKMFVVTEPKVSLVGVVHWYGSRRRFAAVLELKWKKAFVRVPFFLAFLYPWFRFVGKLSRCLITFMITCYHECTFSQLCLGVTFIFSINL